MKKEDQKMGAAKFIEPGALVKTLKGRLQKFAGKNSNMERTMMAIYHEFEKTPILKQCALPSVMKCALQGTALGLEFGRQCHMIPFKVKGAMTAVFVPNYQGLEDVAYRSRMIDSINAGVAYENDTFEYMQGTENYIRHKINIDGDRGEMKCVWACANIKGSAVPVMTVLTKDDILKIKNNSPAVKNNKESAWTGPFEWKMWRKSGIKDLCKLIPSSPDLQSLINFDNAAEAGQHQVFTQAVETEVDGDIFSEPAHVSQTSAIKDDIKKKRGSKPPSAGLSEPTPEEIEDAKTRRAEMRELLAKTEEINTVNEAAPPAYARLYCAYDVHGDLVDACLEESDLPALPNLVWQDLDEAALSKLNRASAKFAKKISQ